MLTRWLSKTEEALNGANCAIVFDFNDIAAATTATAVTALSVLAGHKVQVVGYKQITAFDRSGTGAATLNVGDGNSATSLMAAIVIAVDGTEIIYHIGGSPVVYLVDDTVDFFWTDSGSMAYTSGKGVVYLHVQYMPDWPNS